jgi:GntR family transcriptional regulator
MPGSGLRMEATQEGLVRINRKCGAVIRRDASSGPPSAARTQDWTGRLATMLAEAAAQGMRPEELVRHCRAAVTAFALPDRADDGAEEAQTPGLPVS